MPVSMSGSPTSPKKGGSPPKTERDVAYDELRTSRLVMTDRGGEEGGGREEEGEGRVRRASGGNEGGRGRGEGARHGSVPQGGAREADARLAAAAWAGLHKTSPIKVDTNSRPTHWGKLDEQEASRLMRTVTKAATARAVRSADSRKQEAAEAKAAALAEQKQQEAAALAMRQAQRDKAAAEKAATLTKAKQIQKEMAAECKKQQKDAEAKAKVRYEKAKVERRR